ncbi:MAG TPA: choice-of-anchor tandem repeat GloVer-containing protein, partial [Capsulimonadaceae bacterium]|nr:choice-of-anchor tandem repeat GloVer-containing protein [Capsulimonadaceae bacterium]
MDTQGNLTTLYKFSGTLDGYGPSELMLGPDGNFYGATYAGGGEQNDGTLFRITPEGALTTLHTFNGSDGLIPSGLVMGSDGAFYGLASTFSTGRAEVFRITSDGLFSVFYSFPTAQGPNSLVLGPDGNLYGTTENGGIDNAGAVFRLTPGGSFQTVYSFTGGSDWSYPDSLILGSDGAFYGTTSGIRGDISGTVFRVTAAGLFSTLTDITFQGLYGANAYILAQGQDGNLYGGTDFGGDSNGGSIFKLSGNLPKPATHFLVSSPPLVSPGRSFPCVVTALDQSDSVVLSHPGTIFVTSTDQAAGLPKPLSFTNGKAIVPITLSTNGGASISVFDTSIPSIDGTSSSITVGPGAMNAYGAGLQMFSAPADFSASSLDLVFDPSNVTLAVWQPSTGSYAISPASPADIIRPGVGYWARFAGGVTLFDKGQHTNPLAPFDIPLSAGWNMIG